MWKPRYHTKNCPGLAALESIGKFAVLKGEANALGTAIALIK
ncbi:hypothetical protein [Nostoc sp.]